MAGAALALGVPPDAIAAGLASFEGVGRRLERKGEGRGVVVYDDYGHHPTAIRETLAAIRQREPGKRIWAVYEPLTYHRTAAMLEQFAEVLAAADAVAIADIWAGRDPDTTVTSAAALADAVARRNPRIPAAAPGSVEATADWLAGQVRSGDAVLVMGGGRSYRIAELLRGGTAALMLRCSRRDPGGSHAILRPIGAARCPQPARSGAQSACPGAAMPGTDQSGGQMAGESSFDVVSDFDDQEMRNALDQVRREVQQRYDFKGATFELTQAKTELVLLTDDEFRAKAIRDLIESKAVRRSLSLKIFDWGKIEPAGGDKVRQHITLRRGLDEDLARKLSKLVRDEFPKVKPQIQGDALRVFGKNKDDLQRVIARLRELDEPVALQFTNYR